MAAMRLASEQQLSNDCLTGVGSSDRLDGRNSPSLESLMTLLWATRVFEKRLNNEQWVGRQPCRELEELFKPDEVMGLRDISYVSWESGPKKSLEEWRSADSH